MIFMYLFNISKFLNLEIQILKLVAFLQNIDNIKLKWFIFYTITENNQEVIKICLIQYFEKI